MRDYDIVYPWIQLRQEDGTLTEPQRTSQVLKKLNFARNSLVLLAPPRTDASSKGPEYPICRIIDRTAEEAAQAAQAEKNAAKRKEKSKELELNWAIAPHDLRTKMTQLKRFLGKGYHVTVTLLNVKKRDKRRASADEAKEVLKAVEAAVAEVPGAKETKAREGSVGNTVILSLHAPAGSAARAAAASAEAAAAGKPEGNEV
jgi:translation initiation factor IF-3